MAKQQLPCLQEICQRQRPPWDKAKTGPRNQCPRLTLRSECAVASFQCLHTAVKDFPSIPRHFLGIQQVTPVIHIWNRPHCLKIFQEWYTTGYPLHHQGELTATDSREGSVDRHYCRIVRITSWGLQLPWKTSTGVKYISTLTNQIEMNKREVGITIVWLQRILSSSYFSSLLVFHFPLRNTPSYLCCH